MEEHTKALLEYLNEDYGSDEEISVQSEEGNFISLDDGTEFLVCDEHEKKTLLEEEMKETLTYFNPSFLSSATGLPQEVFEGQEYSRDVMESIFEATNTDFEDFVRDAEMTDGAGHFLSTYDGIEIELENGFFAYRIN
ncbi:hypothetical protein AALK46_12860 [Staphylococcus nepalensis]|uniref:hypothetical protein n=1 Tax=Staphylococcus TaxID=1279 RepID=UPI002DBA9796|nr:hypothetical protein [Staphylococcus pseudoxylosus]MEB6038010.1 hypothetical protein [Staphylococcus pseudoxylosus]